MQVTTSEISMYGNQGDMNETLTKKALEAALPYLVYLSDDEDVSPEMEKHLEPHTSETRDLIREALAS